jgi:hypothetical protein
MPSRLLASTGRSLLYLLDCAIISMPLYPDSNTELWGTNMLHRFAAHTQDDGQANSIFFAAGTLYLLKQKSPNT